MLPQAGNAAALSHLGEKVWPVQRQTSSLEEAVPSEELQNNLWRDGFSILWWDNRRSKPDFVRQKCEAALWLSSRSIVSPWVESQLAKRDGRVTRSPASVSTTSGQGQEEPCATHKVHHLEVEKCRKLCDEGPTGDAVNALAHLVQRGCYVPNNLFYRVLKRCIATKDLVLGSRIHALTIQSGYDGDAFLATHLIGLYASHGKLTEARGIFARVSTPNVYCWASIIFAHARHGEAAAEAIRLYRQMRQSSSIRPDNRIYTAVLKACASAGDLVAGKEVHSHILAGGPGSKFDVFVQNGLVDMYAKCKSLEDARKVFDSLPERNMVTLNAMISGYAQQGMGQEALDLYSDMKQEKGLASPDSVTFVCLLQACANVGAGALDMGKQLHLQIEEQGLQDDVVVGGSLVNMYAKCSSGVEDARAVFDRLSERNVVTWNAMLAGYGHRGLVQEALNLYSRMQQNDNCLCPPNAVTFLSLLQACASAGGAEGLEHGKQVHEQIERHGLQGDVVVGCSLVNMYAKCGSVEDARRVFDGLAEKNVVTWTAMIAGYAQQGMGEEALSLYDGMQAEGLFPPDSVTFVCLLQACASVGVGALHKGNQLHAQMEDHLGGLLQADVVVGGSLVNMYAKCGSVEDARRVFDGLAEKHVVTWTAMIAGYAQQGMGPEALSLYNEMQQNGQLVSPNSVTFVCLLQAIASMGTVEALQEGRQLHEQIQADGGLLQDDDDVVVGNSLLNMYVKCGDGKLEDARRLFDRLPNKNVVTWTTMIAGYAQRDMGEEALGVYSAMMQQDPDGLSPAAANALTFVSLLQACASVGTGALHQGKRIHAQIEDQGLLQDDVVVGGSLVNMYAKCGSVEDARRVFDLVPHKNTVTWNAMLAGYVQRGMGTEALSLYYGTMEQEGSGQPDCVTFVCLLQACASVGSVEALCTGKRLHEQIRQRGLDEEDAVVGCSLVNMYSKCGSVEDARRVFDKLRCGKDVVTWNAMLAGYAQQGMGPAALGLYQEMQQQQQQQEGGVCGSSVTLVCLIQACASVAGLPLGKQLHSQMIVDQQQGSSEQAPDATVGAALVNMYAKCGSMADAQQVFDSLPEKNVEAWGALIGGYGRLGDGEAVFALLDRMRQAGAPRPASATFLNVLTACSHLGLVDKGRAVFQAMSSDHGVRPGAEHFACLVDMLGRAGRLDEALRVARSADGPAGVWYALLGACQKWTNVEIGQQAFESAVRVDDTDAAAAYVMMANIYAKAGMWEQAGEVQRRRKRVGAWKRPGRSWWTDERGVAHTFFAAGDVRHPESGDVCAGLEQLLLLPGTSEQA